ncbi:hypothetical protein JR316_0013520, partial [Psilocybe cubensis]
MYRVPASCPDTTYRRPPSAPVTCLLTIVRLTLTLDFDTTYRRPLTGIGPLVHRNFLQAKTLDAMYFRPSSEIRN